MPTDTRKAARRVQIKLEEEQVLRETLERQLKARRQFRRLVRQVIANLYWLTKDISHYAGDDHKMRVARAKQNTSKGSDSLTVAEKAMFMKRAADRTEEEIWEIQRLIEKLNCFKRYPHHVKRRLASRTYFQYVGPGRVVLRENHLPMAMYFILAGEVVITKMTYDEVLKQTVSATLTHVREGGTFGEVSLLHGIPRSSTATTTKHCEFILLYTDDFVEVLYNTVLKEWMIAEDSMRQFTYFKYFEPLDLRNCCIESKMLDFEPDDIIFGDGHGLPGHVYFILSGRVQFIETLLVKVDEAIVRGRQRKHYELYEPKPKIIQPSSEVVLARNESTMIYERSSFKHVKACGKRFSSYANTIQDVPSLELFYADEVPESTVFVVRHSICSESSKTDRLPKNVRVYHMQVCKMLALSTFGIGENMMDRRIVALTKVRCMILSRYTLDKISPNIWRRVQHFLEKKIPTKQELFKVFVKQQRWAECKDEYVERVASRVHRQNATTVHDVPYSIRMEEIPDISYSAPRTKHVPTKYWRNF